MASSTLPPLSTYQKGLIFILACLLFSIVVDYMALSALSAVLLPALELTTKEFGILVSAYAFSAGISGFLATGFADSFDRKQLLMVYYGGFLAGILLCALAHSFVVLLIARIVTGISGGVVASICFAIVADLFAPDQRGRVMGYVQLAFAASLVAGLPLALYLATNFDWHLLYGVFLVFGLIFLSIVFFKVKPVNQHLNTTQAVASPKHSLHVMSNQSYWTVFLNNVFLVLGDVMFMTFGSAYLTNNLGVSLDDLPILFGLGGVATILLSPVVGRFTDRYGKLKVFTVSTVVTMIIVGIFSQLGSVSFWLIALVHTLLFAGINARMIAATAMTTLVPNQQDRGAFMSLDASLQQLAGGVAAIAVGWIVFQATDGKVQGYPILGGVVIGVMLMTIGLMYLVHLTIERESSDDQKRNNRG
ncbi:MAG: MFS transporter [Lewinella sp.]